MSLDFSGRTAVVIGSGLAAGIGRFLEGRGAAVFAADCGEDAIRAAVDGAMTTTGRIDILITAPDQALSGRLQDTSTADFEEVLRQGLMTAFWASQAALPHMRAADYGRIVNCVSGAGAFGADQGGPLSVAHAGVIALTRSLALGNLDRAIAANVLAPVVLTPSTAPFFDATPYLGRHAFELDAVMPALSWLSHERCTVNGEAFSAGAGRFAKLFTGATLGVFDPALPDEDFATRLDDMNDARAFITPRTLQDELVTVAV